MLLNDKMSTKISLSVKFIIQPPFFHPFISDVSSTMEFSNSSTLVHQKKISLRRDFFYVLNSALVPSAVRLNKHFSLLSSESSV